MCCSTTASASEAEDWRDWLLRAIAGDPADVQIMYGLAGERRLDEWIVRACPATTVRSPVRVGNGAYTQFQGDVFGEVMLALQAARSGARQHDEDATSRGRCSARSWATSRSTGSEPDNGIWEIRGPQQHFTHSRVMLWAAFDCAVRAVESTGSRARPTAGRRCATEMRDEIEAQRFRPRPQHLHAVLRRTGVDASLLQLPQVGYFDADDPRMLGTVAAIEAELLHDGLLMRYRTETGVDGLPPGENPFLACSFWLVEQYARSGRAGRRGRLMDRLCRRSRTTSGC